MPKWMNSYMRFLACRIAVTLPNMWAYSVYPSKPGVGDESFNAYQGKQKWRWFMTILSGKINIQLTLFEGITTRIKMFSCNYELTIRTPMFDVW